MLKKYGEQRFIGASLGSATGGRTAERPRFCLTEHPGSKCRIHHPYKNIAVEKALAPSGVQVRKRFGRRYSVGRFAGVLQLLHTIARHNQHVPILDQIGFVAQRAMPRNDLGVGCRPTAELCRRDNLSRRETLITRSHSIGPPSPSTHARSFFMVPQSRSALLRPPSGLPFFPKLLRF